MKKNKKPESSFQLLKQLCEIHAPSGHEEPVKKFLLDYVKKEKKHWLSQPEIIEGKEFQDCLILKFGKPTDWRNKPKHSYIQIVQWAIYTNWFRV